MATGATPTLVLLGSPRLQCGRAGADLPDKLPGYLVAYLATRGGWVLRAELGALLWPQVGEAEAQNNLRVNLARLRPHLAAWGLQAAFVAERRRLRLDVASDVAALRAAQARGDWAAAAARGGAAFLDGLSFRAFQALGEWARAERQVLHRGWRDAVLRAAPGLAPPARLDLALRGLQADPYDEDLLRLRLDALAALGRGAEAQRVYADYDARARAELGVGASRTLADRARRLSLDGGPAEGGDDEEPLIGRDTELDGLVRALRGSRLVLIVGLGGSGKTRLARAAQARLAADFEARLWLAARELGNVDGLVHALADGLQGGHATVADGPAAVAELARRLGRRSALLVIDGAEHLPDPQGALPGLLEQLLDACPGLAIVMSSRVAPTWPRAALLRLGGLALPASDGEPAALTADAVRLFVQQARRVRPGFDPRTAVADLATIARLTGGLPLALRITAGWMRFLSCADIAAAIPREIAAPAPAGAEGADLHALLDGTWQRLTPAEQEALARLSVFGAPFSAQAAGEVAQAAVPVLGSLVDQGLLLPLPPADAGDDGADGDGDRRHFELHALVRQFAAAELARNWTRQHAARARHADHVRRALARAQARRRREPGAALRDIARLLPECRLAWAWAAESAQPAFLAETAPLLASFFEIKGRHREGVAWMAQAARTLDPGRRADLAALAATGVARGRLTLRLGDPATAEQLVRQALEHARAIDHHGQLIDGLVALGMTAATRGTYDEEIAHYERARRVALGDGDAERAAAVAGRVALPLARMGRLAEAEARWRESLAAERDGGRWLAAAQTTHNLARLLLEAHRLDEAQALMEEALRLCDEHGFTTVRGPVLVCLAQLHFEAGRAVAALPMAELALAEALRSGERRAQTAARLVLAELRLAGPDPDLALPYARDALHEAHVGGDRQNVYGALDVHAQWCARRGDAARAALLWHLVIDRPGASRGIRDAGEAHRRSAALPPAVLAAARAEAAAVDLTALVEQTLADYARLLAGGPAEARRMPRRSAPAATSSARPASAPPAGSGKVR